MAFADVLQRIGRIIGLYSEDDTGYDEQEGEYIQQEPPEYDQPEQPVYTTMGMNGSYTSSGARPKRSAGAGNPPARVGAFIRRLRSRAMRPDNVIPMPEREDVEEGGTAACRRRAPAARLSSACAARTTAPRLSTTC